MNETIGEVTRTSPDKSEYDTRCTTTASPKTVIASSIFRVSIFVDPTLAEISFSANLFGREEGRKE